MQDFRLTIDANRNPTAALGMKFVRAISDSRSLYHFFFRLPPTLCSQSCAVLTPCSYYLDSTNASDFFRKLEQLFYMDPPTSGSIANPPISYKVEVEYCDSADNSLGTMQIEMILDYPPAGPGSGSRIPLDSTVTFNFSSASAYSTGQPPPPVAQALAGGDATSFYIFFCYMLQSNPPSPPS